MELRLDAVNSPRRVILSDSEGSHWTKEILRSLRSLRMTKGCGTLNEVKDLKVPVILSDSEGSHWTKEILRSLCSLRMTKGCGTLNEVKDLKVPVILSDSEGSRPNIVAEKTRER